MSRIGLAFVFPSRPSSLLTLSSLRPHQKVKLFASISPSKQSRPPPLNSSTAKAALTLEGLRRRKEKRRVCCQRCFDSLYGVRQVNLRKKLRPCAREHRRRERRVA